MRFRVIPYRDPYGEITSPQVVLNTDEWDDYRFRTTFHLIYFDGSGRGIQIGSVKIGQFNLDPETRRTKIPSDFSSLDDEFFSLGQDADYYSNLNELGDEVRNEILSALNDVAADPDLFERALEVEVTGVSLLRSLSPSIVRGQFHRLVSGGARLTPYAFTYSLPADTSSQSSELEFDVTPDSRPPTNIHVIIGRNGVGKTRLLQLMARTLVEPEGSDDTGCFGGRDGDRYDEFPFANLVSVSFSAFDEFEPLSEPRNKSKGLPYSYIGLKRKTLKPDGTARAPKSPSDLAREFVQSVKICRQGPRLDRWRSSLETLEADPIFADANIGSLANDNARSDDIDQRSHAIFQRLSSGHKIVLLTVTRLVETVAEKTLVLLDEPEAHLHPPLLSAFLRALSDLLIHRNGVAIVATHSPVVLQEVPRTCVWKIRRTGTSVSFDRPETETFGENVGILTREVFGLEVTLSGFHRLISDSVLPGKSFDQIVNQFDGHLGGEALALIRAMVEARDHIVFFR